MSFATSVIRKLKIKASKAQELIAQMVSYCDLSYVDERTIDEALKIHDKYKFSYYDSLIVASALEHGCTYLLSEDMADGQVIESTLTIKNIFK